MGSKKDTPQSFWRAKNVLRMLAAVLGFYGIFAAPFFKAEPVILNGDQLPYWAVLIAISLILFSSTFIFEAVLRLFRQVSVIDLIRAWRGQH